MCIKLNANKTTTAGKSVYTFYNNRILFVEFTYVSTVNNHQYHSKIEKYYWNISLFLYFSLPWKLFSDFTLQHRPSDSIQISIFLYWIFRATNPFPSRWMHMVSKMISKFEFSLSPSIPRSAIEGQKNKKNIFACNSFSRIILCCHRIVRLYPVFFPSDRIFE